MIWNGVTGSAFMKYKIKDQIKHWIYTDLKKKNTTTCYKTQ